MNLRSVSSLAIVASAAAARPFARPGSNLSANSALGSKLLSKARRLGGQDDEYDFTWAADYSIVFHSCHTTLEFRGDAGGESNDNGVPTETNHMVMFKLCPSDSCGASCKGGEYLVEMREFVESYLEYKEEALEYACEQVKDNCSCDDDDAVNDDDVCLSQCYVAAGLSGCEDENDNGDDDWDFEVDRYLECEAVEEYEDDDSKDSVYVGAYCSSNGKGVHLGTFTDRQCTQMATLTYEGMYGRELPYASESLVGNDCISCVDAQNDEDDDGVEVLEFCEEVYERSAKCERHLDVDDKVLGGCEYIHKILPRMEALARGSLPKSAVFAWLFGFTTLAASGAAFFFFTKSQRGNVQLSSQGDGNLA